MEDYKNTIEEYYRHSGDFNFYTNETLRDIHVSREELEDLLDEMNEVRSKLYEIYIDTHMKMVETTTGDEWNSIIKKINKIF